MRTENYSVLHCHVKFQSSFLPTSLATRLVYVRETFTLTFTRPRSRFCRHYEVTRETDTSGLFLNDLINNDSLFIQWTGNSFEILAFFYFILLKFYYQEQNTKFSSIKCIFLHTIKSIKSIIIFQKTTNKYVSIVTA